MNVHSVIQSDRRTERARLEALISGKYGEFGRSIRFEPDVQAHFVRTYENRSVLHEVDIKTPTALILAVLPVMRPRSLVERIGYGNGTLWNVEACSRSAHCIAPHADVSMRERLREVMEFGNDWLLGFDHLIVMGDPPGRTVMTARLTWFHEGQIIERDA